MKKMNRKGFTIVELVIVIAVVAILAAVLIPTFSSLVKKANMSADQQAVRQMNTLLTAEDATNKPANVSAAIVAMDASGIDMKDYKPLTKDMYFYWIADLNRVVYTDKNNKVIFPADLAEEVYSVDAGWYSLAGIVAEDDSWESKVEAGAVEISSGAQLVSLMKAYADKDPAASGVTSVKLTSDVDLKGASASFGSMEHKTFTFDGDGHTIYGMRVDKNTIVADSETSGTKSYYGYGLVGAIAYTDSNVVVKNVTISDAVIYDTKDVSKTSTVGVIAASVNYGASLTIDNVTVENCYVHGQRKVATLVGLVSNGDANGDGIQDIAKLTLKKNISISGTVVGGNESAKIIGAITNSAKNIMDIDELGTLTVDVTVKVDSALNDIDSDRTDVQTAYDYSVLGANSGGNIR